MTYIKQVKDSQTIAENVEGKREIYVSKCEDGIDCSKKSL